MDHRLRTIIAAFPPFDERTIRPAWSHYMALAAGVHPWPDANHRTASLTFSRAVRQGLQVECALAAACEPGRTSTGRFGKSEPLSPWQTAHDEPLPGAPLYAGKTHQQSMEKPLTKAAYEAELGALLKRVHDGTEPIMEYDSMDALLADLGM